MKKKRQMRLVALFVCVFLVGCGDSETAEAPDLAPYVVTEAVLPVTYPYPYQKDFIDPVTGAWDDAGREAAWDDWMKNDDIRLHIPEGYREGMAEMTRATAGVFLTSQTENAVYSPLNTYIALGMLAEVMAGEGRAQILQVLGAPDVETMRTRANGLWRAAYYDDGALTSVLSSSLWMDKDMAYKKEVLQTLKGAYYASAYQGEMGEPAYDAAMQAWLNEKTGDLLTDAAGDVKTEPETVLTMLSAVHYKAKWANGFRKEDNEERTFHGTAGDVTCTFLKQTDDHGGLYVHEDFTAVCRRMESGGQMWFILPDTDTTADALLLGEAVYDLVCSPLDWQAQRRGRVHQYIPKFDICSDVHMSEGMKALGITIPFDKNLADYTPLAEGQEVFLSEANQTARVVIDEKGVMAASFVEMELVWETAPPDVDMDFILDRPFLFAITGEDNVPLFLGVVNQP